jgi:hypothetical protein
MSTARIPITLEWTGASGSPGANVWHARGGDPIADPADFNGMAEILQQFYTDIAALIPNQVTISFDGEVQGVGDDVGEQWDTNPWTMTGSSTGGYAPPANCLLAQWRAATGGRSGRGRTFIGPLTNAIIDSDGTPQGSVVTTLQDAIDDLVSASTGFGNGALGIYSRVDSVFRDFVSGTAADYFAVLRSRRD